MSELKVNTISEVTGANGVVVEQLDQLYHDMTAGKLDATGEWHKAVKAVKDANPKE